jgi:hypothetical protein
MSDNNIKKNLVLLSGWKKSGKDTVADIIKKYYPKTWTVAFADELKEQCLKKYEHLKREGVYDEKLKERAIGNYPACICDASTRAIVRLNIEHLRTSTGERVPIDPKKKYTQQERDEIIDKYTELLYGTKLVLRVYESETKYYARPLFWTPRGILILEGSCARSVQPRYWVHQLAWKTKISYTDDNIITDFRFKSEYVDVLEEYSNTHNIITWRINRFDSPPNNDASERDLDDFKFDVVIENKGTLEELEDKVLEEWTNMLYKK